MRVRIGNQSAFSAFPVTGPFEFAVTNGFDAFEWFPDKKESGEGWTEAEISKETRASVRETAHTNDITLSVHAPWHANPLEPEGRDRLMESVEFAKDIGASLLNVHLPANWNLSGQVRALAPLLRRLTRLRIKLSFENTTLTGPEHFNELFNCLTEFFPDYTSNVGMCLDLGHANLWEGTRNDYLSFIDHLGPHVRIIHIHAHENYGDGDSHLSLFTGPAGRDPSGIRGFVERMVQRGFAGSIILEQWPNPPTLLNAARNRLLGMIQQALKIGSESPPVTRRREARLKEDKAAVRHQKKRPGNPVGTYSSPGLLPHGDFADLIAENDQQCESWRQRLILVHELVTQETGELGTAELVYLAIYLRFISTGQIPAGEDGSHHRPSQHARMAQRIHDRLAKISRPDNVFVIRKIYAHLPSFDNAFTKPEPLTRIRDIAHRNDIPRELKKEIKHSLQNKLHRCAGPEDLETSTRLLERITAPDSGLSTGFVSEFRQFHEELKEFFNARSLREQLEAVCEKAGIRRARLIHQFLAAMERTDILPASMRALDILTKLRESLAKSISGNASAESQKLELADIKLEEFLFVLLSKIINQIGADENSLWSFALESVVLTVDNLRLSGFNEQECRAVASELNAWSSKFNPKDREQLIRLKAAIDRCSRLSDRYASQILALFPARVERLGHALGVSDSSIRVFSEADIRSHPVFQLSKLVAILERSIRDLAELPPWDTVVPGETTARLMFLRRIDDIGTGSNEPVIALLERVEGVDDIPPRVSGIVVLHQIPHLSHFAVRARQAKVVLALTEDAQTAAKLKEMAGQIVTLEARADKVLFNVAPLSNRNDGEFAAKTTGSQGSLSAKVVLSDHPVLLSLGQASLETAGAKSAAARMLEELSRNESAGFKTPSGCVIPFGVMEGSLKSKPALEREYRRLIEGLEGLSKEDFSQALEKLRFLTEQLDVPQAIIQQAEKTYPHRTPLMVRSSSNLEDMPSFSGAGLYESVANVSLEKLADAVRTVWSSLWSARAAVSRKHASVPQDSAHMAVLIQEMIVPDLAFILHTANPLNGDRDQVYAELAPGLGQTLAAGETHGTPYRMICSKKTGASAMLSFASYSTAWIVKSRLEPGRSARGIQQQIIDYSRIRFSRDEAFRNVVGMRLAAIGSFIENAFGCPQDIEGLLSRERKVFLVQSRPQQGFCGKGVHNTSSVSRTF